MYIDEKIKLPDNLPENLQDDIKEMREYYRDGDWLNFEIVLDRFEPTAKHCCSTGAISESTLRLLYEWCGI